MSAPSLNSFLQKALLSLDPQVKAFDNFYLDFFNSPLSHFYKKYHTQQQTSYNLMGRKELLWIQNHTANLSGTIFEIGSGLSPVVPTVAQVGKLKNYTGVDFSSVVIEVMKANYPEAKWRHGHFSFLKIPEFNHGFCLDASYNHKGLQKIIQQSSKSFLISRIHHPEHVLTPISEFSQRNIDFTTDYAELINHWLEFLETMKEDNQDITMTHSWKVIYNEMQRHLIQLDQNKTKRTVTLYEKNT